MLFLKFFSSFLSFTRQSPSSRLSWPVDCQWWYCSDRFLQTIRILETFHCCFLFDVDPLLRCSVVFLCYPCLHVPAINAADTFTVNLEFYIRSTHHLNHCCLHCCVFCTSVSVSIWFNSHLISLFFIFCLLLIPFQPWYVPWVLMRLSGSSYFKLFWTSRSFELVCTMYVWSVTDSVTRGSINRPARHCASPVGLRSINECGWWAWSNMSSHRSVAGHYKVSTCSSAAFNTSTTHQRSQPWWFVSLSVCLSVCHCLSVSHWLSVRLSVCPSVLCGCRNLT